MYSVKFMNDQEFESLPYRDMGEKVGVCDRNRGEIYVRSSGMPVLDTFNTIHEIEHMEDGEWGRHANHQDPEMAGVYYKGFGDFFSQALPMIASAIPGVGSVLGPVMSATGNFGLNKSLQSQSKAPDSTNYGSGNVMQSFQPQQPQASVVNPTSTGGGVGPSAGVSPGLSDKVKGYFGGRSPQDEFRSSKQTDKPFGSFGGF